MTVLGVYDLNDKFYAGREMRSSLVAQHCLEMDQFTLLVYFNLHLLQDHVVSCVGCIRDNLTDV